MAKKYHMKDYLLHAKQITFLSLKNNLSYLNHQSFTAPLYPWQITLIQNLSKGGKENDEL